MDNVLGTKDKKNHILRVCESLKGSLMPFSKINQCASSIMSLEVSGPYIPYGPQCELFESAPLFNPITHRDLLSLAYLNIPFMKHLPVRGLGELINC